VPDRPEETPFTAEIADGRVLALMVNPTGDRDAPLVQSFVSALRHRRERDQLARLTEGEDIVRAKNA
jgi:hypothetical protein